MNRIFLLGGLLAAMTVVTAGVQGADDLPDIKTIMKTTHGKGGLKAKAEAANKKKDFETVATVAKEWEGCAAALAKNTPPKGEASSWKKLTDAYTTNIQKLSKAAADKDAKGVAASLKVVGSSCGACHKAHK
jgi:cytochrome c556